VSGPRGPKLRANSVTRNPSTSLTSCLWQTFGSPLRLLLISFRETMELAAARASTSRRRRKVRRLSQVDDSAPAIAEGTGITNAAFATRFARGSSSLVGT
jgi:hypothetical protein